VKLFQQDGLSVFGLGGTPLLEYTSKNFIYAVSVQYEGDEILRIQQRKGHKFFASNRDEDQKSTLNVTVVGERRHTWTGPNMAGLHLPLSNGREVELRKEREAVRINFEKLQMVVQSLESKVHKDMPNHLNFLIEKGLDLEKATGTLPELWGIRPMSNESASMVKDLGAHRRIPL